MKRILRLLTPTWLRRARWRTLSALSRVATTRYLARRGARIQAGPFAGMQYIDRSFCSGLTPKLIGTYEQEIRGVVEDALSTYDAFVDVGAAEGYYAVGLAYAAPQATVHAFEAEPDAQGLLRSLASLNGVADRVEVLGLCRDGDLCRVVQPGKKTLVICDVEGHEADVLACLPSAHPTADVLVEIHEFARPGVSDEVRRLFAGRQIDTFIQTRRPAHADPEFPLWMRRLLLQEWRPETMSWLYIH